MSESQNTVPNGSSGDVTESKSVYDSVKTPVSGNGFHQQPFYAPQQVDGVPRPQLQRIDSRANIGLRPGYPNPLLRPQLPRPPPPGGTQFVQRPPLPQQVQRPLGPPGQTSQSGFPGQPSLASFPGQPGPGQIFQQRPPHPLNGAPRPPNVGLRPGLPFQRPPAPAVRPQLPLQRPPVPGGVPRPPFNNFQLTRSPTLDSTEILTPHNEETTNKSEVEKPALAAMKNRSFSVSGMVEPKNVMAEDRRRSVSSIGVEEEKRSSNEVLNGKVHGEILQRPDSRADLHMNRIDEDEDTKKEPAPVTNNSVKNVTKSEPLVSSPSPQPSPIQEQEKKSPITENTDKKNDRKSPELKTSKSPKLSLFKAEGDNDSGVDESTQGNEQLSNGDQSSPKKSTRSSTPRSATTPVKNKSFTRGGKSPNPKSPETPTGATPGSTEKKKVPMNKIQVGSAPSPNLKVVKSKIGSLENATHKPGGGHVKIESRKVDFSTTSSRITAKNDTYTPGGGDKKISQQKLAWSAKSKIGSLENTTHKPKGGDKKIESVKLDFKDKAKSKVGSKDNIKHTPGGGDVKNEQPKEEIKKDIETKKLDIKVQSKIKSLDNIKHKPGGGEKKIFDDKDYLRQMSANSNASLDGSQKKKQRPQSIQLNTHKSNLNSPTQLKVRILEDVEVCEFPSPDSRPSSRLSRVGSIKSKRPATPRPRWRY